jgi:quercetin dioxygenase-like cupin family protein
MDPVQYVRLYADEQGESHFEEFGDWHPAPARQFLVVLEGEFEVSASDGETRRFGAGSVLLVEDTTGKGHMTRALGEADASTAVLQI